MACRELDETFHVQTVVVEEQGGWGLQPLTSLTPQARQVATCFLYGVLVGAASHEEMCTPSLAPSPSL